MSKRYVDFYKEVSYDYLVVVVLCSIQTRYDSSGGT